ncbi:tetratricopeptide repeat protein [Falsiroseomonas oryziterrae]|uniref:tetratricopeptide repeat protein n=1 Tax=Falsiroseomonas oryziterrae TaxID=2911368 RepID=UPI001F23F31C|nr:tetratricopeptide repeat protein [Roseomonas sp. NPKOSM-4]
MLRLAVLPLLTLGLLNPPPALAQAPAAPGGTAVPGQGRPDPSAQRRAELDRLFEALRDAPDTPGGQMVESRIRAVWAQAVSPAAALLLRRGMRNLQGNEAAEALEDFDAALVLEPGAPDLWILRARALARLGDRAAAARDLQEALRLEPRHFGALLALSEFQDEAGNAVGALRSLDAALALHPRMPGAQERRRELQRRAEGDAL